MYESIRGHKFHKHIYRCTKYGLKQNISFRKRSPEIYNKFGRSRGGFLINTVQDFAYKVIKLCYSIYRTSVWELNRNFLVLIRLYLFVAGFESNTTSMKIPLRNDCSCTSSKIKDLVSISIIVISSQTDRGLFVRHVEVVNVKFARNLL